MLLIVDKANFMVSSNSPTLCFHVLSRQTITKRTFRQYRQLGKGGFGEVRP